MIAAAVALWLIVVVAGLAGVAGVALAGARSARPDLAGVSLPVVVTRGLVRNEWSRA